MAGRSVRNETDIMISPRGLRSPSSSSDIMSASGRSAVGGLPTASPKPAYIAQSAAETLASTELDRPTSISEPALDLVNSFLDQVLYSLLGLSKSPSLPALKAAVPKLLKPRLGQAAVRAAEEDLQDMMDGEEIDGAPTIDHALQPTDFDLELAWRLARLRCMAYARLGDMEDEDADEYLEQDNLQEFVQNPQISTNSNSTFFVTSVLEFLGEQALCTAAQHAERRHTSALVKKAGDDTGAEHDDGELFIDIADMMQLGREGPLSRMWRSWRRDTRAIEPFTSRSNTPATMMSPNMADLHHSRSNSLASPDQVILEEDSAKSAGSPSQIPLPMSRNDVNEIEVPGLAPVIDEERQEGLVPVPEKSKRRPVSMIMVPGGYMSPPTPSSPTGPSYQERSPLRPTWHRTRSNSLPTPIQSPLASPRQNQGYLPLVQNGIEEHADGSETPTDQVVRKDNEPAPPGFETAPAADSHGNTRASIISGAVGAIAGALGIEALRSPSQNKDQKEMGLDDSDIAKQPRRTVAEEIMGPSNNVAAPSDARTSASINNVGDFDSMHIPVVASNNEFAEGVRRQREVSDPEDLALSSADEGNAAQTTEREPRDSGFGVAGASAERATVEQRSTPSSPSSPKRLNREAAVFQSQMIPMRQEEELEPQGSQVRRSMISDTYATAPTSQRYSGSYYSHADRDSSSLPVQRPTSGEQQSSSWPTGVPIRGSSLEQPKTIHMHSASKSSQYSRNSQSSTSSSRLLGFQRDQSGRPLNEQRASFKDGSSPSRPDHSRDTSLATDKLVEGGVVVGAVGAAGALAARRQHLRLRSDSEDDMQVDEDKKKSLEILIKSDETLHYTLTPETARPREDLPRSPSRAQTQTQELADFFRHTGPPGEEQTHPATSKTQQTPINALRSNPPDQLLTPVEQRAAQFAAAQAASQSRNPLGGPRDARPERNTTRDLADYARSTGPATVDQLPPVVGTRPGTGRSAATAGGLRHDGVPMAPVSNPSINSDRSTLGSNRPANRLKFQARDARPARDGETSDLIDFIREGPPRKAGEHRIDRHVAPFRTTMDSDDLNALAPPAELNGRNSVGSAQDSSVMTGRSVQESTNSRTGLLESHKPTPKINGASSAGRGIVRQTIPEMDGMPPRKRRDPRDPYAIDDSDNEALEEELARPPPRNEETLIDFLRNTAPPPGMAPKPILSAGARQEAKPEVKRSTSQSKLRDVLMRQNSTAVGSNGSVKASNGTPQATTGPREDSPHLTQVGSKLDKYRPTQTTHAAHVARNRQKSRVEPRDATNVRTGTSDLADYLKNSGPPESPSPSSANEKYVSSNVKEQAGFLKFFKQRGSVRR